MPKEASDLFFLSIIPPSPLREEIQEIKLYVSEKYSSKHSLKAPPHLTILAPFRTKKKQEAELTDMLDSYCRQYSPFTISFNGYSSFPPRTLFLDVKKNNELMQFQERMENFARSNQEIFNYNYDERPFHPHLTMAFKDLSKSDFRRAWDEFKNKKFEADFKAENISLLKHDGKRWEITEEFAFGA